MSISVTRLPGSSGMNCYKVNSDLVTCGFIKYTDIDGKPGMKVITAHNDSVLKRCELFSTTNKIIAIDRLREVIIVLEGELEREQDE